MNKEMVMKKYTKEEIKSIDVKYLGEDDNQAYADVVVETVDGKKFDCGMWTCYAVLGDLERNLITDDVADFINYALECEAENAEFD
jgi:hypothetical protein